MTGPARRAPRAVASGELRRDRRFPGVLIHESAYVDEAVTIGEGTTIWHFCHVLSGAQIGRRCSIGQNVMIGHKVKVGNGCKVQNNVSLYQGVVLEDDVFCGPSCVFTNVINPRAHISRKAEFKATLVRRGATIGANATILCGRTIGAYAFIGGIMHSAPALCAIANHYRIPANASDLRRQLALSGELPRQKISSAPPSS